MASDGSEKRWRGAEYETVLSEVNGRHRWQVVRKDPGKKDWKTVAHGDAASRAEARYLAEHRKRVVREGDSIH